MFLPLLLKRGIAALAAGVFMLAGTAKAETVQIGDFYYNLNSTDQTATLVRNAAYTGMATITIPASVNDGTSDYSVTGIDQQCFQSCSATSIQLPNTIQTIGKWAFYGCSGLTTIELPTSLTTIADLAFQKCTGLTKIKFPASLRNIGASAFTTCTSLTEAVLNEGLTELPVQLFNECNKLENVTFPSTLQSIGNSTFYNCAFTTIELPSTLQTIGDGVFSHCSKLTKATIPGSIKSLGNKLFYECNALKEVVLNEGIESLGEGTFYNNTSLTDITLPQSLKALTKNLFYGCSSLTGITLPASITSIPDNCFYKCTGLLTASLNDKITEIGKGAFYECTSLLSVTIPASVKVLGNNAFTNCSSLAGIVLNEGLEEIGETVFNSNTALRTITIPASVTTIRNNPFIGCKNLTTINVAEGSTTFASTEGVLTDKAVKIIVSYPGGKHQWVMPASIEEIAPYSFNNLPDVSDITFSPNIKKVGVSAFYGSSIREVIFTDKLETIEATAFFMVRSIEKIVLGNSDFKTNNNCFSGTAISQLLFPESVTTIGIDPYGAGYSTISSAKQLKAVWLPSTLEKFSPVGSGCDQLAKIYCWAKTPPTLVGYNTITIAPEVYVPKGTASAYQEAWSTLYPNITFKEVLPGDPVVEDENGMSKISWEPFTEEGYIGNVRTYTLTLYSGQGDSRTEIFSKQLNANGEESTAPATGDLPAKITVNLGELEPGDYSVSLRGFTTLGEMVMNFDNNFSATTSGIQDIISDSDASAEYYNLQGIRIAHPTKGNLYIMRKGNVTEKIIL